MIFVMPFLSKLKDPIYMLQIQITVQQLDKWKRQMHEFN